MVWDLGNPKAPRHPHQPRAFFMKVRTDAYGISLTTDYEYRFSAELGTEELKSKIYEVTSINIQTT